MKKAIFNLLLASVAFSALAEVVIRTKTPLKNKDIVAVVVESAAAFLEYEGDEVSGGLDGDLKDLTIVEIVKEAGKTKQLKVEYTAFFISYDWDFGDPVDEEFTKCTSVLKKVGGKYSAKNTKTTCNFNPATDISNYEGDPCCSENGPVIDSNWCFDYYEEGMSYCRARGFYEDDDLDYNYGNDYDDDADYDEW